MIFSEAQQFHGCYHGQHPDESIWYPEDSDDLAISLMFKSEENALGFIGQMANFRAYNRFREGIEFDREPATIRLSSGETERHIWLTDCNSTESTSPDSSYADTIMSDVTSDDTDAVKSLRSLEDLSRLAYRETINKCYIAGKKPYPAFNTDPNNIIFGSHLFHDYFDGDGKRPPPGANVDWGTAPELAVIFVAATPGTLVNGEQYSKIEVDVVFRNGEVAAAMASKWRNGSKVESELRVNSYFYSRDAGAAEKYLKIKYVETSRRWDHCNGLDVDFTQIFGEEGDV
jgi:hypothetical protein